MEAEEIDTHLEELEIRLERLRALYQMYFLGIEKIEPQVARKDVDRRIWMMRRAQIRNTRRRFKFNTLVQRYNTYQQYWQRILREIEAGTYVRHLLKAEKKFGNKALTIAEKRRLGRRQRLKAEAAEEKAARSASAVSEAEAELAAMMDGDSDALAEAKRAVDEALGVDVAPPSSRVRPPPSVRGAPASEAESAGPTPEPPPASNRRPAVPAAQLDDLDLDLDIFSDQPAAKPKPPPAPEPARKRPPAARPPGPPARQPASKVQPPARPVTPREPGPRRPPLPPARPPPRADGRPAPERRAPAPASPRAAPPARPAGAPPRRPPARGPAKAPVPPAPAARSEAAGGPRAPAKARPKAAAGTSDLSDARVKEIYANLVQAKRKANESTRGVTVEGLAKSLRSSLPRLKKKHAGKKVDFDVVIRNGKAVVKPVVK